MSEPTPEETTRLIAGAVAVPKGSITLFGVAAVSYLDDEGELSFGWALAGEPTEMEALGLLQMTSIKIVLKGVNDV